MPAAFEIVLPDQSNCSAAGCCARLRSRGSLLRGHPHKPVQDRLLERRHKLARFRDPDRALDNFDFDFNKKMNRALLYELATARFIARREDEPRAGTRRSKPGSASATCCPSSLQGLGMVAGSIWWERRLGRSA
jgi:hypothetical protein